MRGASGGEMTVYNLFAFSFLNNGYLGIELVGDRLNVRYV